MFTTQQIYISMYVLVFVLIIFLLTTSRVVAKTVLRTQPKENFYLFEGTVFAHIFIFTVKKK
jgi:hypothetical protein